MHEQERPSPQISSPSAGSEGRQSPGLEEARFVASHKMYEALWAMVNCFGPRSGVSEDEKEAAVKQAAEALKEAGPAHPPEDTPIEAAGDLEAAVDAFGDAVEALTKAEYRSGSDREIRPYKEAYYEARAKILEWGHLAAHPGTAIEKAAREGLQYAVYKSRELQREAEESHASKSAVLGAARVAVEARLIAEIVENAIKRLGASLSGLPQEPAT